MPNSLHQIVCVDDDPAVLRSLKRQLNRRHFRVLATQDPNEALDWVRTREISVVISDQRMPAWRGTDLLDKVRRHSPSTARIILTAYPQEVYLERETVSCAEKICAKPWDPVRLEHSILGMILEMESGELDEQLRRTGSIPAPP